MFHDGLLKDNKTNYIVGNQYETLSDTEANEAEQLKHLEIDLEQVEYL
jgi:hypothetical protein